MPKKINKSAANDWKEDQIRKERIEEEADVLWYAVNKRGSGYPSPEVFDSSMPLVAQSIREAYQLLEAAYEFYAIEKGHPGG